MLRRPLLRRMTFILLALLLVSVLFAANVYAQDAAPAAEGGAAKVNDPLKPLIKVFDWMVICTILILSIFGLTLIIQGFIRNRMSVFMPETSTNTIREMIGAK